MSTTIIALIPGDHIPYEPQSVTFAGNTVWAIVENSRVRWVSVKSIIDVFPGIEKQGDWQRLARKQQILKCLTANGRICHREFINKEDYLKAAGSHPNGQELLAMMAAVSAELDDKGVVFNPRFQGHPLVQASELFAQNALRIAELEYRVDDHDNAIARVAKQTNTNTNHIEELLDDRIREDGRSSAVDGIRRRGWLIGTVLSGVELGGQMSAIAQSLGDRPPREAKGSYILLLHLSETFNEWEKEYGPKYPKLHSWERDRMPPDRSSLAWLKKSDQNQGKLFL